MTTIVCMAIDVVGWSLRPDVHGVALACVSGVGIAMIHALRGRGIGWLVVSALAALVLPQAYTDAVAEGAARRLTQALGEGRVVLAEREAEVVVWLRPSADVQGVSISTLLHRLKNARFNLERLVLPPLQEDASRSLVGQRVDALIQLERPREALALLEPLIAEADPVALDYRGLCMMRRGEPEESLAAYREALAAWEEQSPSPRRRAGRINALQGIAYAARQLDRRAEEEEAYRSLVAMDTTPSNRLLLARCYHDHGKTKAAAKQIHEILLSTSDVAIRTSASDLLVTMRRDHFGCLQVPRPTLPHTPPSPDPRRARRPGSR